MEEKKSIWPYILRYGSMMGLVHLIIVITTYLLNPDITASGSLAGILQTIGDALNIIIFLVIGTNAYRNEAYGGYLGYGISLKFALGMSLPLVIIAGIYTFIFFKIIDPEFIGKVAEKQAEKLAERGMSDDEIERSMSALGKINSPGMFSLLTMMALFFETLIIGLITSIFTHKQQKAQIE